MPASTITMPEAKRAAELYGKGLGQPEIARTLGRSRKAVRTALRCLGVQSRSRSEAIRGRKLTPQHRARISEGLKRYWRTP